MKWFLQPPSLSTFQFQARASCLPSLRWDWRNYNAIALPHRKGRELLAWPARPPQLRISIPDTPLYNLIESAHNSYASNKAGFSFKRSDASQIRIFSDVKLCPLAHLDRKLFKPKTTFGPPTTSLPSLQLRVTQPLLLARALIQQCTWAYTLQVALSKRKANK